MLISFLAVLDNYYKKIMTDKKNSNDKKDDKINPSCKECCAKIPQSTKGISVEVDDYVYYFCGKACYKKWKNRTDCCSGA